jgi:hypothetical protein
MEDSGQSDVVDVMPGGVSQRPVLAPAGDAPVYQPRLARHTDVRAEAQALHHAWAKTLNERVSTLHETENGLHSLRALEVDAHARASAMEYLPNLVGDQDILAPIENVREHPLFLEGPTFVFQRAGHRFFYEDAEPFNDIAHQAGYLYPEVAEQLAASLGHSVEVRRHNAHGMLGGAELGFALWELAADPHVQGKHVVLASACLPAHFGAMVLRMPQTASTTTGAGSLVAG